MQLLKTKISIFEYSLVYGWKPRPEQKNGWLKPSHRPSLPLSGAQKLELHWSKPVLRAGEAYWRQLEMWKWLEHTFEIPNWTQEIRDYKPPSWTSLNLIIQIIIKSQDQAFRLTGPLPINKVIICGDGWWHWGALHYPHLAVLEPRMASCCPKEAATRCTRVEEVEEGKSSLERTTFWILPSGNLT